MRSDMDTPLPFKAPLQVIGPIGQQILPGDESYALYSPKAGAIGYWPKTDVHEDGYWRLTRDEAQFIADACNEKAERDERRLKALVREHHCQYQCDERNEIEDNEGLVWPCPIHGDFGKETSPVGAAYEGGDLLAADQIYTLLMRVAEETHKRACGPGVSLMVDELRNIVDGVLSPSIAAAHGNFMLNRMRVESNNAVEN